MVEFKEGDIIRCTDMPSSTDEILVIVGIADLSFAYNMPTRPYTKVTLVEEDDYEEYIMCKLRGDESHLRSYTSSLDFLHEIYEVIGSKI
jgi:hypothetical protein